MRALLLRSRIFEARDQLVERQLKLSDLAFIVIDMPGNLGRPLDRLLQVSLLPLATLMGMLDGRFVPGNIWARSIVEPLDFIAFV